MLLGRNSAFRAGFGPDCYRESTEIGSPERAEIGPGALQVALRPISDPEALLRNIEYIYAESSREREKDGDRVRNNEWAK